MFVAAKVSYFTIKNIAKSSEKYISCTIRPMSITVRLGQIGISRGIPDESIGIVWI